jgi:hypothetical protein
LLVSKYMYMNQEVRKNMKTSEDKTMITISQVTNEFVWKIDVFYKAKEKICKGYIKNK